MSELFSEAADLCQRQIDFALACIISDNGSAPRGAGAKMLVLPDSIVGTVGGGGMEHQVICYARDEVLANGNPVIRSFDLAPNQAAVSDFMCGGRLEVLTMKIDSRDPVMAELFREAAAAVRDNRKAWLFFAADNRGDRLQVELCLSLAGQRIVGHFSGSAQMEQDILLSPCRVAVHGDGDPALRYIIDPILPAGHIYLFGAGHVSREVARLALTIGFRVTVIDDRAEYASAQRFPNCGLLVTEDLADVPDLPVGPDDYILIITRGHVHDYHVLAWAIRTEPRYLGMIGSRTKRDKLYDKLREQGVAEERIAAVHCPVGLQIGAQTPEEIAVSICGELIQCRAAH